MPRGGCKAWGPKLGVFGSDWYPGAVAESAAERCKYFFFKLAGREPNVILSNL